MSPSTLETLESVLLIMWGLILLFGIGLVIYGTIEDSNHRKKDTDNDK